ncbi:sensor histidine kinase [Caballeronia sp. BR00000012568055]|uniref:sensor histidine kinase n=1 Tax=Caballeronia sp. BR00000012568055 TaxID=2918761 RepID=UPI0023F666F7|nr:sensor histidine kinase [Caballeronia sp. BR00000012568055]
MTLSLRSRLLLWLMVPLAPFVIATALTAYDAARHTADYLQDGTLLSSARTIIEDVQWIDGRLAVAVQPAALEIFESPSQDRVFYKVIAQDGRLLAGSNDLAVPPEGKGRPFFFDCHFDGMPIRAVVYSRQLFNDGKSDTVTVVVGKTQGSRQAMLDRMWRPLLLCECLMLFLVAALVPLGLAVELKPLMQLKNDVAGREPMQLEPMHAVGLPRELQPIVDAINQCIAQLKLHSETQRQFVADAAHQLCTPLALLDTQIQYAVRICEGAACADALNGARRSTGKMKTMTHQLLLLAQAESAPQRSDTQTDLAAVVASVLSELVVAAQARDIDLGAECDDHMYVTGDAPIFAALIANLVDNAIRYTQRGGRVTASVNREDAWVVLRVIDNGPGIAAELLAHVFERFRRGATLVEGSGLGLSIVRKIAQRHGGSVVLGSGSDGRGLTVTVKLPAWAEREYRDETAAG